MSYQVLARKYRPRTFAGMVGQGHVLRALINGLDNDRLHHAFLFTGTRGVGKTTVARILAKCLNCETGVSSVPCGECGACVEIDGGRFVDLIEVDAASRTKVEDTRELLDNVQYAPGRGRYKVYLIDEVHMLSGHSFNALLKTLEEPPPHVKFLLATTDPQKVPVTILSRCLQFNLKRLPADLILEHVLQVLEQEGVAAEERAVQRLARAADGSMRDALSLTDQAIAHGGGAVADDAVRAMLGGMEDDAVLQVLEGLAEEDAPGLLETVATLTERAPDFQEVLAGMLAALHTVSLLQGVPEAVDPAHPERNRLQALADALSPEDVQLFYQIGLHGRRDLPLAPEPRAGFEMILLRMLQFRPREGAEPKAREPARAAAKPAPPRSPPAAHPPARQNAAGNNGSGSMQGAGPPVSEAPPWLEQGADVMAMPRERAPAPRPVAAAHPETGVGGPRADAPGDADVSVPPWPELLEQLGLGGISYALAMHCTWGGLEGGQITLRLESAHGHLRNRSVEQRIEEALGRALGRPVTLRIESVGEGAGETPAELAGQERVRRQRDAEEAIAKDPNIKAMQDIFDAEVIADSIQPRH